ncbi:unnamed protein product [Coffea canephora]|uniref:F-box domain-containing protein n=3 Tax=Coffea TaxID=13442 RepID=A0A068TWB2_COFCA|nr:F-box protein At1g61340-like isoform X2 [Coffea arabica]XP_027111686.1 F-box protein At1g61340-like isoform X2 [Coffea arabica]XP_027161128.1 F-box protein At1g61340-like isoform X2 [Coffea eugenioides]CDO99633.1 unnamed protein product [Coffea canephora]
MALGKKCGCNSQRGNGGFGMGLVRSTSFGRKRVALPSNDVMEIDCFDRTPTKKRCSYEASFFTSDKSTLEALPQDVLIRILCGVEHDDLKRLFFVSKSLREATLIAKQWHFAYSTPRKTLGFPNAIDLENLDEFNEIEQAPRQVRIPRARLSSKKLADISVALFTSAGEENWPRRELFVAMDAEI